MKSKRGAHEVVYLTVIIVALLFYLLIYSGVWNKLFGKGISDVKEKLESAGDYDKDNVINVADKCPCFSGLIENDGCPSGYKIAGDSKGKEIRECPAKT